MSDWINVEDRLPDRDEEYTGPDVLAWNARDSVLVLAWYDFMDKEWRTFECSENSHVIYITHWQPLPDPPECHDRQD